MALSVGIFPYVLKLLQSPASDLREVLIFIWTKIISLDRSCQADLVKDNGHIYFITVVESPASVVPAIQRTMACYVLAVMMTNYPPGQDACLAANLIQSLLQQLPHSDPYLRRWLCLCLGKLWFNHLHAKTVAVQVIFFFFFFFFFFFCISIYVNTCSYTI
jgi:regulatory associated protein of mTOR